MNTFTNPEVEEITMMGSAQCAKTTIIENIIGRTIHIDPQPILFMSPTKEVSKIFSKEKLEPMVMDTPELRYRGYEDQDVFNRIYAKDILSIQERCWVLTCDQQKYLNCCVGYYNWGVWLIHFFSLSKGGLQRAFHDFYPFQKDGEPDTEYQHRLEWIKKH